MKILILGCGNVGANVARQLVPRHPGLEYVIGDLNAEAAAKLAGELGGNVRAVKVDIGLPQSLEAALDGVDLVFNAVGPFYRSAVPVIEAALRSQVDYMDINDDHDVAEKLLLEGDYDARARAAGIRVIIGCGSTPGLTNVMARLLVDRLDKPTAIHLSTVVPFVPGLLSPTVIDHMMHITSGEVVQFEDGKYCLKPGWGGRRDVAYGAPFGTLPSYLIGHGETVTLPHFIKGLGEVSNRIGFFPEEGNEIWRKFVDLGFANAEPIDGIGASPLQFMMHYLQSDAGQQATSVDLSGVPWGVACRVEVEGERDGARIASALEYHIDLPTEEKDGETADPTPTCARLAIEAFIRGEIAGTGLLSPEVCLDAEPYVKAFAQETGARVIETEQVIKDHLFG
ncbi:MAG: saccharopine dehydrogenase NADP-binding domain-containing protein [Marinobacter sp.]|nr:saccharopine dehydrogenase NADP-binding domain-containing protein [Marinobacter sp.]